MIVHEFTITVVGTGQFPIDMLRYDRCVPKREQDTYEIERSFRPRDHSLRIVKLISPREPTLARWQSFDWEVESVEKATLRR